LNECHLIEFININILLLHLFDKYEHNFFMLIPNIENSVHTLALTLRGFQRYVIDELITLWHIVVSIYCYQ